MKTRWLSPCFLMVASCVSFVGDDSVSIDPEDTDAAAPVGVDDGGSDAEGAVVTSPGVDAGVDDADVGEDDGVSVDAAPPPVDELTEAYGVFVSRAGSPSGDGTRGAPLSTIGAGISKAKGSGKRVYVCKGTYAEAVALESGVSVFGGYACETTWAREDGAYSRVESPTIPALRAKDIVSPTTFSGFDVVAPDAPSSANASSIGLVANNATKLVIADSKITAGKGRDGASGVEPSALVPGPNVDGKSGSARRTAPLSSPSYPNRNFGGGGGTSLCGGGPGGRGGTGAYMTCGCGGGSLCSPTVAGTCYTAPSVRDSACGPVMPEPGTGSDGAAGVDGASATLVGLLSSDGYAPADGTMGTNGAPGAGGVGGFPEASAAWCGGEREGISLGSGGGGGAGGCGGIAGTPGAGGGASIAALVWISPGLVFDRTELVASAGGAGGKGTFGATPTIGGKAGSAMFRGGEPASKGGDGGRPGVSGSGAGGPSLAIAVHGPSPKLVNDTAMKPGLGGAGVLEATKSFGGQTWKLKASGTGITKEIYEF